MYSRLIVVSTCSGEVRSLEDETNLLRTVQEFALPQFREVVHICVFQNVDDVVVGELEARFEFLVALRARQVPLSRARNMALVNCLAKDDLASDSIVCFPDDDAWYYSDSFSKMMREWRPGVSGVCGAFSPEQGSLLPRSYAGPSRELTVPEAFRYVNSNSMFIAGDAVLELGSFDENYGVGALFGSGEDVDFVVRLLRSGRRLRLVGEVLAGHPDKGEQAERYFEGSLALLRKHSGHRVVRAMLVRRILGGVRRVVRRELPLGSFSRSLRALM